MSLLYRQGDGREQGYSWRAAGGEQTGEESQGSTITDVHRNSNDENNLLDIAGEVEVSTQGNINNENDEKEEE